MYRAPGIAEYGDVPGLSGPRSPAQALPHAHKFLGMASDLFAVLASAFVAMTLRFPLSKILHERTDTHYTVAIHLGFLVLYSGLIVMLCNNQRLYSRFQMYSSSREFLAIANVVFMAGLLLTGSIYISGVKYISRMVILCTVLLALVSMIGWRAIRRRIALKGAADGFTCHNVLIVGCDVLAKSLETYLAKHREFGFVVAGLVNTSETSEPVAGTVGHLQDLPRLCQAKFIDEILLCAQNRDTVKDVLAYARSAGLSVRIVPDLYDGIALGAPIDYLGTFPTISLHQKRIPAIALTLKRTIDVIFSAFGLLLLLPALLAIAIAVKVDSPGPILYASNRVGKKGRIFGCLKFRTMVANADELREQLSHLNERDGVLFKISADPRITSVGRFLRKYSLDELPQLWNVIRGEMSIVGPRPPLANEVELYELEYLRRLEVPPGITGLWQVEARSHPSFERYISLDLQYVEQWSLLMDLRIIVRTMGVVLAGTGS
jgi:exopolysaccharide biosynthesis polyprenyl glycosylphosphotransferase